MKKSLFETIRSTFVSTLLPLLAILAPQAALRAQNSAETAPPTAIVSAQKINPTTVELLYSDGRRMTLDFYGENIFRMFRDDKGGIMRDPEAKPEARILVDNPRKAAGEIRIGDADGKITVATDRIKVIFDKASQLMTVVDAVSGKTVAEQTAPIQIGEKSVSIALKENPQEYFYGGGVQNGRFSHKGKSIAIENQNSWTDGGVASPTPFYWSTEGYGVMWYTFRKGRYDFGAANEGEVLLSHDTDSTCSSWSTTAPWRCSTTTTN